ncbi:hypothetical protein RJT34_17195 [Clitoria ternatea]|uniref:Uncharacterized protein n=1 Tax=Clitoria ternatea TaxID=43366 RepID=A0AAN9J8S2_CLITE
MQQEKELISDESSPSLFSPLKKSICKHTSSISLIQVGLNTTQQSLSLSLRSGNVSLSSSFFLSPSTLSTLHYSLSPCVASDDHKVLMKSQHKTKFNEVSPLDPLSHRRFPFSLS